MDLDSLRGLRELIKHMKKGWEMVDGQAENTLFQVTYPTYEDPRRKFTACALGCVYLSKENIDVIDYKKKGNYPSVAVAYTKLVKDFPVLDTIEPYSFYPLHQYITYLNDKKRYSIPQIVEILQKLLVLQEEEYNGSE